MTPNPDLTERVRDMLTRLMTFALDKMADTPQGLILRSQRRKAERAIGEMDDAAAAAIATGLCELADGLRK